MRIFLFGVSVLGLLASGVKETSAQTFSAESLNAPQKAAQPFEVKSLSRRTVVKTDDIIAKEGETMDDIAKAFERTKAEVKEIKEQPAADDPLAQISQAFAGAGDKKTQTDDKKDIPAEEEEIFIPEGELYRLNTPTLDNSVRGGQAFVEVDDKGRMKKVTKIFLYYDQFRISAYMGSATSCDVRFNVLSNLDRKINQLDVKLVWPEMTTTLSFSNVQPNTQTYYNYTLLGNGCYNMDKAPNIIVNRCRVKGMTAAECANKLIWLSK